jgi:hypothetical protein
MSFWRQCPIVAAFIGACGLRTERKRRFESSLDNKRNGFVLDSYDSRVLTGQSFTSSG